MTLYTVLMFNIVTGLLFGYLPARKDIFGFEYGDFTLENYVAHKTIKAPIAV